MKEIAYLIKDGLCDLENKKSEIINRVGLLCDKFPLYNY